MKHRSTRLKVAFALEGVGAATQFAKDHQVSVSTVCRIARAAPKGLNIVYTSGRLERAMDLYIERAFAKHRAVLDLGYEELGKPSPWPGFPQGRKEKTVI